MFELGPSYVGLGVEGLVDRLELFLVGRGFKGCVVFESLSLTTTDRIFCD